MNVQNKEEKVVEKEELESESKTLEGDPDLNK